MSDTPKSDSKSRGEEEYELYVDLVITRFTCSPAEVTDILGVQPSATRNQGDTVPKTIMLQKHNLWELTSGIEPKSSYFDDHIFAFEKQLHPIKNRFLLLPDNICIGLACHISNRAEFSYPAIHLSSKSMRFFASIGAEIDIDIR